MPYPTLQPRPVDLPVAAAFDEIVTALTTGSVVLIAAPGAGKSTLVPFAVDATLAATDEAPRRIVMLEPRRLAARATAARLADLLGEDVGQSIGLTVRGERKVGPNCRIEVMTEAVLTRRLQSDPELGGIAAIIFDEFHERNLHSDLGLAMALEVRDALRPDLRLLVMSATIDPAPLLEIMSDATSIDVPGRTFPIATEHRHRPPLRGWTAAVADAVIDVTRRVDGDVLVFAPGRREIDDLVRAIEPRTGAQVIGLHGGSAPAIQRAVLKPSSQQRIIIATAIAETSITIPGVEAVVDGGLLREARFDAATGLGRLETGHVTRFSADQRRGRAGRTRPGICIRMWSAEDDRLLRESVPPEIVSGDPLPVAAELLRWGGAGTDLPLLDPPPPHRIEAAISTFRWLGLADEDGQLTLDGRAAAGLPTHPRVAALLLKAQADGKLDVALTAAAIIDDDRHPTTDDLVALVDQRRNDRTIQRSRDRLRRALGRLGRSGSDKGRGTAKAGHRNSPADAFELAELLACAWPDRIALARPDRPDRYLLAAGREVKLAPSSPLRGAAALVVVDATVVEETGRVRLAVALERSAIAESAAGHITEVDTVEWDEQTDGLLAERQRRLGAIVLHRSRISDPPRSAIQDAIRVGLRRAGLSILNWRDDDLALRQRLAWLHEQDPMHWPAVDDASLLAKLDDWLDLSSVSSPAALRKRRPGPGLLQLLGWEQRAQLDALAPRSLPTPLGRDRSVRYDSGRPVWSARIQDLFGLDEHPLVGPTRAPLTIELLSPANRVAQTTNDLPGFWRGSYAAVRADLRGRYPKHAWPEDPTVQVTKR